MAGILHENMQAKSDARLLTNTAQQRKPRFDPEVSRTESEASDPPSSELAPARIKKYKPGVLTSTSDLSDSINNALKPRPNALNMVTMPSIKPVSPETKRVVDFTNFVVGGEMSAVGMSLDAQGLHWSLDALKHQWSETPLWHNLLNSASLIGTVVFPAAAAASATYKFGKLGKALGNLPSDVEEIVHFKNLGLLENDVQNVSEATMYKLRKIAHSKTKYSEMDSNIEALRDGNTKLNPIQMAKGVFDRSFANTYYKLSSSNSARNAYNTSLDSLWKNEQLGKFFTDMPDPDAGKRIYQSWFHDMDPTTYPKIPLTASEQLWSGRLRDAMKSHQQDALESGLISQETFDKVGSLHIPAVNKGDGFKDMSSARTYIAPMGIKVRSRKKGFLAEATPEQEYIAMRVTNIPRLDSTSLMNRKSDLPSIYSKLLNDELVTHPSELTIRGYVEDRLLLNNFKFIRDVAINAEHSVPYNSIVAKYIQQGKPIPSTYVSLASLPNSAIIQRMISKIPDGSGAKFLGPNGELPFIRKSVFDEIVGETGIFAQTQQAADLIDVLTTIHKTSKTALNIPTHLQNYAGNMVFWAQAGMNPLSPENINMQHDLTKVFLQIHALRKAAKDLPASKFFDAENGFMKGVNLGKMRINGKTFDLNKELFDPITQELIEDSAFDSAEGFSHLQNVMGRLKDDQVLTRKIASGFMKAKNAAEFGGKYKWFDALTKAYAAEDVVPKMAMFLKLRGEGLTKSAAVLEVGRRMPMYQTVGSTIGRSRKFLFPWASFPTEALRITKNNIMDHPIRMMPWLQLPGIMQGIYHEVDPDFNLGQTELAKRMLPTYAQNPQTVVGRSGTLGPALGAAGGALMGGMAGGIKGGAAGAVIGAIAGGVGGYQLAKRTDSRGDEIRAGILNFLPHSAFLIQSNSPDITSSDFMDVVPAEPLAILRPLINIAYGKGQYGEDIASKGPVDTMSKVFAGLIGFVTPPIIQKYGFRVQTPDVSLTQLVSGGSGLGLDPTNVSQALIDSGQWMDPRTNKPGNFTYTGLFNNLGLIKSYSGSAPQMIANQARQERYMQEVRNYLTKNLDFFVKNGKDEDSVGILKDVMATFAMQHSGDGFKAQEQYSKWLQKYHKTLWQNPKFRSLSAEDFEKMMGSAGQFSASNRGVVSQKLLQALQTELNLRGEK